MGAIKRKSVVLALVAMWTLVSVLPVQAADYPWSINKTDSSVTGYTEGAYKGFYNSSTLGTISKNDYRGKVSTLKNGVVGSYSEHDHWERKNRCVFSGASAGATFGINWNCNQVEWVRIKKDVRSPLMTSTSWSGWRYTWATPSFQALAVGAGIRTCLDKSLQPNVCSPHVHAGKNK